MEARSSYLRSILGPKLVLDLDSDIGITIATGVSKWQDLSGRNNSPAQAVGATQPSRVSSVLDGHAAIRCNGSQFLASATFGGLPANQTPTVYAIGSWTGAVSFTGALITISPSAVVGAGLSLVHFTVSMVSVRGTSTLLVANTAGQSSVPALFVQRANGTTQFLDVNGTNIGSTADAAIATAADRVIIGAREDTTTQLLTGDVFKHIVVNPAPTTAQHSAIMSYLRLRYPSVGIA